MDLSIIQFYAYDNGSKGVPHRNFLKIPLKDLSANRNEDDGFLCNSNEMKCTVDLGAYGVPAAVKEKDDERPFDK